MIAKKNILIFCHSYVHGFIEANNQYTKIFDPEKYTVTVVYLVGAPCEEVRQLHLSPDVRFLNSPNKSTRGLKLHGLRQMLALQRAKQFQIVVCHRYKPSYIMLLIAKFSHIPAIFCVMSDFKTFSPWRRKLLFATLAKKNLYLAGVSDAVRDDLRKDIVGIPQERIITLYNMIDIDKLEPEIVTRDAARQILNLKSDDFVFGILARLAKAKDHKTLIQAFALAKPHCPKAKLLIMGDGVLETEIRQQIQLLQLEDSVILAGYLPKAFSLLKAFDVFVLSSIKEAFGRVLLESMIASVPILATRINGIPEVLGETGYLVDPQNPEQLAKKMLALYSMSPQILKEEGKKSYQRAEQSFSIPRFKEIFFSLPIIKNMIQG